MVVVEVVEVGEGGKEGEGGEVEEGSMRMKGQRQGQGQGLERSGVEKTRSLPVPCSTEVKDMSGWARKHAEHDVGPRK